MIKIAIGFGTVGQGIAEVFIGKERLSDTNHRRLQSCGCSRLKKFVDRRF